MEYTVVKDFIERGTLKEIKAGEKYTCLDPLRAEKLIGWGYIEKPAEKPIEKPEKVAEPEKKTAKAKTTTAKRSTKAKKA